jgi:hypothetical protein
MNHPNFQNIDSLVILYHLLVDIGLANDFNLISKLIWLVLTISISTLMTEQAFSFVKFIKNQLWNTIEDEFVVDYMIIYIERDFAISIDSESIIEEFYSIKKYKAQLR